MRKLQVKSTMTRAARKMQAIQSRSPRGSLDAHLRSEEHRRRRRTLRAKRSHSSIANINRIHSVDSPLREIIFTFFESRVYISRETFTIHVTCTRARTPTRDRDRSTWARGVVRVTSRDALTAGAAGRRDATAIRRRRQQHPRRSPYARARRKSIDLGGE